MDVYGRSGGNGGAREDSGDGGRDGGGGYDRGRNDGGHQRRNQPQSKYQPPHRRQYEQQHQPHPHQHRHRSSDQQSRVSSEREIHALSTEVGFGLGHAGSSSTSSYGEGSTSRRGVCDTRGRDSLVPEMQLSRLLKQMPLASPPDDKNRVLPVRRPDDGGKSTIKRSKIFVNHFHVKYNSESIIWHYDVDISLEEQPKRGRPYKIHKPMLRLIRNKLFSDDPEQFPLSDTAYDGEKNIFSAIQLPCGLFKVEYSDGEDVNPRSYLVKINLVNGLKLAKLKDYLSGNLFSIPRDVMHGLDVVMKENPMRHMITFGRSFHPTESHQEDDLGHGIIASRGFQHSLKPTNQGLALCLDYSVLAFRKQIPVIEYLEEHIKGFNINSFGNFRKAVEKALRGLKVTVTYRNTKQKFTIMRLTDKIARHVDFPCADPEGNAPPKLVGIVDYFLDKYQKNITYKDIPCLDLGKNNKINYIPMEFCVLVDGQRYPKENLDKDAASRLKCKSLASPQERMNWICNMAGSDSGPCRGQVIKNFGLEVHPNMTEVFGRVIGPPELKLGSPSGRIITVAVENEKCQWNLDGKSVVEGRTIERWAIVDFSAYEQCNQLNPNSFIPKLRTRCRNLGIYMEEPLVYKSAGMNVLSNPSRLRDLLETINGQCSREGLGRLQIIVCVMAKRDPGYKFLKWMSETKIGVLTQCCLSSHANRANDQYLAKLALKINAKLGGSNVELNDNLSNFGGEGHVMFVGADVNHPGPRNIASPSVAAVVATVNWPAANRYAARVRMQDPRSEKILNFGEMCLELVKTYAGVNKVMPEKIVIFRDGVSEGQFDMVLNEELVDIKRTIQSGNYSPTITLVVAQKGHQTRLVQELNWGPFGNLSPGTVVDTKIVHPFEFDFYLCSHYGSLGTSKPTHYHVLWDEHNFSSDQLQKLIYNLCFTFARCTKPVSLVPPIYYAHLAAYRGRLYYEVLTEGQSPGSVASTLSSLTSSSWSSATSIEEQFKLHGDVENIMFFV